MKKGCILRTIFFLIIFIAVTLYFFQQKFGNLIISDDTEFNLPFLNIDITEKLKSIKNSRQKIDLEKMIENTKSEIEFIKDLSSDQIDQLNETFDDIFSDSIITENELNYVRDLFKKIKK